jgi:D-alanyl-lipoteichoic acid acyltransferase DltB (MBOAT superfamily)
VLFPTATFALFFALVLPLSWLLVPRPSIWRPFMIGASLVFYGWWNPRFVLLLVAVTIWNWLWGNVIHRAETDSARKWALAAAVIGDLSALGYFKYANFFLVSIDNTLLRLNLDVAMPVLEITLPIGISFFTFQALSYVIDIKRRIVEPVPFMEFAVYITFFPHLVAGPIVRAKEFLPQLKRRPDPRHVDLGLAFFLIIFGMFKKVVLSDLLSSRIVDPVFAAPRLHSSLEIWVATYAYAAQIYCDFSGYTDMAIGLALLLGIRRTSTARTRPRRCATSGGAGT